VICFPETLVLTRATQLTSPKMAFFIVTATKTSNLRNYWHLHMTTVIILMALHSISFVLCVSDKEWNWDHYTAAITCSTHFHFLWQVARPGHSEYHCDQLSLPFYVILFLVVGLKYIIASNNPK
jgi:hypothetical protein